jgi:hypothetical protein
MNPVWNMLASATTAEDEEGAQSGFSTYSSIAEIPHATMQQRRLPDGHSHVAARRIVKVRL